MRFDEMPKEQQLKIARLGGLAPKPKRERREYCNRRHKLEGSNVKEVTRHCWNKDHTKRYTYTTYICRECMLAGARKIKQRQQRVEKASKMEAIRLAQDNNKTCSKGHPLTPENTAVYKHRRKRPNGTMAVHYEIKCRQCMREAYRLKKWGNRDEPDHRLLSKEERDALKRR